MSGHFFQKIPNQQVQQGQKYFFGLILTRKIAIQMTSAYLHYHDFFKVNKKIKTHWLCIAVPFQHKDHTTVLLIHLLC